MKKAVCLAILLSMSFLFFSCKTTPDSGHQNTEYMDAGSGHGTDADQSGHPSIPEKITPFSRLTTSVPENIPFHLNEGETVESFTTFAVEKSANGETTPFVVRVAILNTSRTPTIGKVFQIELLDSNNAYLHHLRFAGVGFVTATKNGVAVYCFQFERELFSARYAEYMVSDYDEIGGDLGQTQLVRVSGSSIGSWSLNDQASIMSHKNDFTHFSFTAASKLRSYRDQSVLPLICMTCNMDNVSQVYTAETALELTDEILDRVEKYTIQQFVEDMQKNTNG